MLHNSAMENKGGFRTLNDMELSSVSGGNLHINGEGVDPLNPTASGIPAGWELPGGDDPLSNGVYGPVDEGQGVYQGSGGNYSPPQGTDPVDVSKPIDSKASSPPSLNPAQGQNSGPTINTGGGTSVTPFTTGSPTNPNGGGVTVTVPLG